MDGLEKIRRHTGKPVKFKLRNDDGTEDNFELKPMGTELFTEFMVISETLDDLQKKKIPEKEKQKIMIEELFGIYKKILIESYPGLGEEEATSFIIANFGVIAETLGKLMPVKVSEEQRQKLIASIEEIGKNVDKGQDISQDKQETKVGQSVS